MKLYKLIIIILVVFLNTKTVLSEKNIFNVNNIELEKTNISNKEAANKAIKKGLPMVALFPFTEKSKKKYEATEIKIKDMMTNIKLEVLRSKSIISFRVF